MKKKFDFALFVEKEKEWSSKGWRGILLFISGCMIMYLGFSDNLWMLFWLLILTLMLMFNAGFGTEVIDKSFVEYPEEENK
jgi:hypothetical protein